MPGMVLMAPSDEAELNRALRFAVSLDVPNAMRYPRDVVPARNFEDAIHASLRDAAKAEWSLGKSRVLREGDDATLIVYGALAENAMLAAQQLENENIGVEVIDARFCKPLDAEMITRVLRSGRAVLTLEDHALQNGFGSALLEYAAAHNLPTENLTRLGMPDRLIAHATRKEQLAEVGLDPIGITRSIRDAIAEVQHSAPTSSFTPA
jgi:1-deoxy-D-xylulose-5-phosphate synthase